MPSFTRVKMCYRKRDCQIGLLRSWHLCSCCFSKDGIVMWKGSIFLDSCMTWFAFCCFPHFQNTTTHFQKKGGTLQTDTFFCSLQNTRCISTQNVLLIFSLVTFTSFCESNPNFWHYFYTDEPPMWIGKVDWVQGLGTWTLEQRS